MKKFFNGLTFFVCLIIMLTGVYGLLGGYGIMIALGVLGMIGATLDNAKSDTMIKVSAPSRIEPSIIG